MFLHYNVYKAVILGNKTVNMNAKDLINYKSLSKILTKNDNGIRKNRIPKKHRESIKELEILLTYWINKNESKNI